MTDRYPPVFVMTATEDFLKDQPPIMVEKLMEVGVLYQDSPVEPVEPEEPVEETEEIEQYGFAMQF